MRFRLNGTMGTWFLLLNLRDYLLCAILHGHATCDYSELRGSCITQFVVDTVLGVNRG